jgi:TetR/AcrR family tetracycline transcriptional repressor
MNVARDEKQSWTGISPPPWAPAPKGGRAGRADKPQLSREAIVAAAIQIIDAEGLDAVSMRRVAQEFGTGAASLYAYVANKDELLDLIVDWVMGEVADHWPGTEPTRANWLDLALDSMRLTRQVLIAHRDLAKAFLGRIPFGPNGLRAVETQLAILRAGGVSDQIAAFAGDLLGQYLENTAIEEDMWRSRYPDMEAPDIAEKMNEIRDYLRSLPKDRFPNVVELAGPMMNQEADGLDRFELGLEVIMRGIASFAQKADEAMGGASGASGASESADRDGAGNGSPGATGN